MEKYCKETDSFERSYSTVDRQKLLSIFMSLFEMSWSRDNTLNVKLYRDFRDVLFQSNSFVLCSEPLLSAFFLLWYKFDKFYKGKGIELNHLQPRKMIQTNEHQIATQTSFNSFGKNRRGANDVVKRSNKCCDRHNWFFQKLEWRKYVLFSSKSRRKLLQKKPSSPLSHLVRFLPPLLSNTRQPIKSRLL